MRSYPAVFAVWLGVTLSAAGQSTAASSPLLLQVFLDDRDPFSVQTKISPGKPFEYSEMHNGEKITLRGEVSPPKKGSYHLQIAIVEWRSEKENFTTNLEREMVLGKQERIGFVAGVGFMRRMLLTRAAN